MLVEKGVAVRSAALIFFGYLRTADHVAVVVDALPAAELPAERVNDGLPGAVAVEKGVVGTKSEYRIEVVHGARDLAGAVDALGRARVPANLAQIGDDVAARAQAVFEDVDAEPAASVANQPSRPGEQDVLHELTGCLPKFHNRLAFLVNADADRAHGAHAGCAAPGAISFLLIRTERSR